MGDKSILMMIEEDINESRSALGSSPILVKGDRYSIANRELNRGGEDIDIRDIGIDGNGRNRVRVNSPPRLLFPSSSARNVQGGKGIIIPAPKNTRVNGNGQSLIAKLSLNNPTTSSQSRKRRPSSPLHTLSQDRLPGRLHKKGMVSVDMTSTQSTLPLPRQPSLHCPSLSKNSDHPSSIDMLADISRKQDRLFSILSTQPSMHTVINRLDRLERDRIKDKEYIHRLEGRIHGLEERIHAHKGRGITKRELKGIIRTMRSSRI